MQIMQIHFVRNIIVVRVCAPRVRYMLGTEADRILYAARAYSHSFNAKVASSCRFDIEITNTFLNGANYTFSDGLPSFDELQPANQFDRAYVRLLSSWILAWGDANFDFDSVLDGKFLCIDMEFRIEWHRNVERMEERTQHCFH